MGRTEQDITQDWNNIPRRVTVSSFYMDETEVANIHYREYLYWIGRVYGGDYPEVYKKHCPIHWYGVTSLLTMNLMLKCTCVTLLTSIILL